MLTEIGAATVEVTEVTSENETKRGRDDSALTTATHSSPGHIVRRNKKFGLIKTKMGLGI